MPVVLPPVECADDLPAFAALVRKDSVVAMRHAELMFSLCPRESKALVLHVPRTPWHCARCDEPVPAGVSVCSCRSAVLNW